MKKKTGPRQLILTPFEGEGVKEAFTELRTWVDRWKNKPAMKPAMPAFEMIVGAYERGAIRLMNGKLTIEEVVSSIEVHETPERTLVSHSGGKKK